MTDQTQTTIPTHPAGEPHWGGPTAHPAGEPQWELIHFEYLWRARLPPNHEKFKTHFAARAYLYKDNELTKEMVVWPVSKKSRAWIDKSKNDGDVWAFCQHATHGFTLREVALTRKKGRSPPNTPPTTPFAPPTPYVQSPQSPYQFAPGSPYPFASPQAMSSAVNDDVRLELQELRAKTLRQEQQLAQMAQALAEVMKRLSVDDEDDNNIRD
jgi:hypothetical protein